MPIQGTLAAPAAPVSIVRAVRIARRWSRLALALRASCVGLAAGACALASAAWSGAEPWHPEALAASALAGCAAALAFALEHARGADEFVAELDALDSRAGRAAQGALLAAYESELDRGAAPLAQLLRENAARHLAPHAWRAHCTRWSPWPAALALGACAFALHVTDSERAARSRLSRDASATARVARAGLASRADADDAARRPWTQALEIARSAAALVAADTSLSVEAARSWSKVLAETQQGLAQPAGRERDERLAELWTAATRGADDSTTRAATQTASSARPGGKAGAGFEASRAASSQGAAGLAAGSPLDTMRAVEPTVDRSAASSVAVPGAPRAADGSQAPWWPKRFDAVIEAWAARRVPPREQALPR